MTPQDFDAFAKEFDRLHVALERFKQSPTELHQRADVYFQVLKRFRLEEVRGKADAWIDRETKMPKPAEWAAQVVRSRVEVRMLSAEETREYERADRLGFEDSDPCGCALCLAAGMADRPENKLRYVPLEVADSTWAVQKATLAGTEHVVTPGRWIHGWELVRWYQARANFWRMAYEKCGIGQPQQAKLETLSFEKRLEQIFAKCPEPTNA